MLAQRLHTHAQRLNHEMPMNLVPIRPPGPNARKARAFAVEILQLRAQGYTFEAIREALAGAGVHVSNSTVQREVARAAKRPAAIPPADATPSSRGPSPQTSTPGAFVRAKRRDESVAPAPPADHREEGQSAFACGPSGKDIAEAFFNAHPSNPLFPTKETS